MHLEAPTIIQNHMGRMKKKLSLYRCGSLTDMDGYSHVESLRLNLKKKSTGVNLVMRKKPKDYFVIFLKRVQI